MGASLVNLVVVSGYSLLVIRLSLTYLEKEEYGLLSLLAQVSAYISMLDLGLSIAFARILVDYTTGSKKRYANGLKTASRIFQVLGLIGFLLAASVAVSADSFLSIPPDLGKEFFYLMLGQGLALGATFSIKPISAPLIANGKHHVILWLNSLFTLVNALLFWLALRSGVGIYSGFFAQAIQLVLNGGFLWLFSRPYRDVGDAKGIFDLSIFREVLSFARDSMLWQIGGQTLASLPIILASAWFALGGAADLSAGMKVILLLISVCTRFGDMSVTPLSIQFANGNESAAASQMARIAGISGGIGVCAAIFVVCANPVFVSWWMMDKVTWDWHANLTGAVWVAILSVAQCLYGYAVISRQLQLIRWALLSECILYLVLASAFRGFTGVACLLWAKPIATLLIAFMVGWRIKKHTQFDTARLIPVLLRQATTLAFLIPLCMILSDEVVIRVHQPVFAFIAVSVLAGILAIVASPFLFTREMRADLQRVVLGLVKRRKSASTPNPAS